MSGHQTPLEVRFWRRVRPCARGCWEWRGQRAKNGYGTIGSGGENSRTLYVHRLIWEWIHGPTALCVCHRCDNRCCVRPSHLFAGTHADNNADMAVKGRSTRGRRNSQAKLTEIQVRAIRDLAGHGLAQDLIAKRFPVGRSAIGLIVNRKRWGWLR